MRTRPDSRASAEVGASDSEGPGTTFVRGELVLEPEAHTVRYRGRRIELTRLEFGLLETLARHPGWVFSKERLLELVWGYEFGDARTVSVHIANLRGKMGESAQVPRFIHTVKGAGYKLEVPPASPIRISSPPPPAVPLVGREEQLGSLLSAWDSVSCGKRGRVLLISGEAGIGKTRLAQELAVRVREAGAPALWGRSHEAEGRPAYLPWMQIVEGLLQGKAGITLIAELGRHQEPLARLYPELLGEEGELPPAEESAEARFRLFDAVSVFLGMAAKKEGPVLIVLDDLHDADAGSLALVAHLARDLEALPILLLACYRREQILENPLLGEALASLAHEGIAEELELFGLDETRVAELIEMISGHASSVGLASRVWDETQGNPFFVTQLARLLVAQGAFESEHGPLPPLPDGVKAIIGRRVATLEPKTRRLLEVASVAGREFSLAVLDRVSEQDSASLLESLAEARNAHLIEQTQEGHRFRFPHNLLRENLYTSLELADRVRLHGLVGDALAGLAGARIEDHLEELAHHYQEAAPLGWRHEALDFCLRAARAAMNRYAWEDAQRHFEQALAVLSLMPAEALKEGAEVEIWEGLGDARFVTEGYEEARVAYLEATARTKEEERLARSRLTRKIGRCYKEQRLFTGAIKALLAAEDELGDLTTLDDVSLWREWLDGKLELLESRYYAGDETALLGQLVEQMAPIMERFGSPVQLTGFLRGLIPYCWRRDGGGTSDECLGYARAYVETARAAELPAHIAFAEALLATALQMYPEVTDARLLESAEHGHLALRLAEEVGDIHCQMITLANLAINGRLRHDAALARYWGGICTSRPRDGEWRDMAAFGVANVAWADWFEGDSVAARRRAESAMATWALTPFNPYQWTARFPLLAIELEEGRLQHALGQASGLLEPSQRRLPPVLAESLQASLDSADQDDSEAARIYLERSVDLARRFRFL